MATEIPSSPRTELLRWTDVEKVAGLVSVHETSFGCDLVSCPSPTKDDDERQRQLSPFKGVIFSRPRGDDATGDADASRLLVVPAFPVTREVGADEEALRRSPIEWDAFDWYPAYEGTLVRVFHWDGEWRLASHRNPDLLVSGHWADAAHTFGETLLHRLRRLASPQPAARKAGTSELRRWMQETFDADLDRGAVYYWLLRPSRAERIVAKGLAMKDPRAVVSVGRRRRDQALAFEWYPRISVAGFELHLPPSLASETTVSSWDALERLLARGSLDEECGLLGVRRDGREDHLKILSAPFCRVRDLRRNAPNLDLAYLQNRGRIEDRQAFLAHYLEERPRFDAMEYRLADFATEILQAVAANDPVPTHCCPPSPEKGQEPPSDFRVEAARRDSPPHDDNTVFVLLPCRHEVHGSCLQRQDDAGRCPLCKLAFTMRSRLLFPQTEKNPAMRNLLTRLRDHFPRCPLPRDINRDNVQLFLSQPKNAGVVLRCLEAPLKNKDHDRGGRGGGVRGSARGSARRAR